MSSLVALSVFEDFLELVKQRQGKLVALQIESALANGNRYSAKTEKFAKNLAQIVKNNPDKTITSILARSDVQFHLQSISANVGKFSESLVTGAHETAHQQGQAATRAIAKSKGLVLPLTSNYIPSHVLGQIVEQQQNLASGLVAGVQSQATVAHGLASTLDPTASNPAHALSAQKAASVNEGVGKAGRKAAQSARAAATVAASRGYNEAAQAQIEAIQAANPGVVILKLWYCQLSHNTCPSCAALHGTTVEISGQFKHDQTFGGKPLSVFGDLSHPPRHPSCHCVIVPHTQTAADLELQAKMKAQAQAYATKADKMAPRAWRQGNISEVAKNSDFMESADFRAASDTQFEGALRFFRQCMIQSS